MRCPLRTRRDEAPPAWSEQAGQQGGLQQRLVVAERVGQRQHVAARVLGGKLERVGVGLAFFQGQFVGKWPEMMAGALVSLLPMIILFVVAQKYFVRGITLSGIKG